MAGKFCDRAPTLSATSYTLSMQADDAGVWAAANYIDLCSSSGSLPNCGKVGSGAVSVAVSCRKRGQTNASRARARLLVRATIVVE
jgi:hypothetical protein